MSWLDSDGHQTVRVYSLIRIFVLNINSGQFLYKDVAFHCSQDDKPNNWIVIADEIANALIKEFTFHRCIIASAIMIRLKPLLLTYMQKDQNLMNWLNWFSGSRGKVYWGHRVPSQSGPVLYFQSEGKTHAWGQSVLFIFNPIYTDGSSTWLDTINLGQVIACTYQRDTV